MTADELRRVLDYNPATGAFLWRCSGGGRRRDLVAGTINKGYRRINIDARIYYAHRLAWLYVHGEWPACDLDHKDNVRDHNWIDNLRPATKSQNHANRLLSPNNTSGFKGAFFDARRRKWRGQITVNEKAVFLGYYRSAEEAHAAYLAAAEKYFGEFARAA